MYLLSCVLASSSLLAKSDSNSIIKFPRKTELVGLKKLLEKVREEEMKFTKEVAIKSDVDLDDKELYAVGNMIKIRELERELEELYAVGNMVKIRELERDLEESKRLHGRVMEEKDKKLEEKDKKLEEKDKEIERLKAQLKAK